MLGDEKELQALLAYLTSPTKDINALKSTLTDLDANTVAQPKEHNDKVQKWLSTMIMAKVDKQQIYSRKLLIAAEGNDNFEHLLLFSASMKVEETGEVFLYANVTCDDKQTRYDNKEQLHTFSIGDRAKGASKWRVLGLEEEIVAIFNFLTKGKDEKVLKDTLDKLEHDKLELETHASNVRDIHETPHKNDITPDHSRQTTEQKTILSSGAPTGGNTLGN